MSVSLDKLNDHINQLGYWLRENQGIKPKPDQKMRLTSILNQVKSAKTFSGDKVSHLKEKPKVDCEYCGVSLNVKNIKKHKKKCPEQKKVDQFINQDVSQITKSHEKDILQKSPVVKESGNETKLKVASGSSLSKGRKNGIRFPDL